ncbi:hypothetical protein DPEC_G00084280 [Dallia pectoralis]|uniref:Uncharacterized protein n=1 Tax=Dallia pectoralis TaxID=75939 RepID=A0ACC2GZA3_DALPE|nr:hypothetical protein DPEC_G00084280 [Dallia pectoralis]
MAQSSVCLHIKDCGNRRRSAQQLPWDPAHALPVCRALPRGYYFSINPATISPLLPPPPAPLLPTPSCHAPSSRIASSWESGLVVISGHAWIVVLDRWGHVEREAGISANISESKRVMNPVVSSQLMVTHDDRDSLNPTRPVTHEPQPGPDIGSPNTTRALCAACQPSVTGIIYPVPLAVRPSHVYGEEERRRSRAFISSSAEPKPRPATRADDRKTKSAVGEQWQRTANGLAP